LAVTIEQFMREATQQLSASSPTARLDAEVLLMYVTGLARTALITHAHDPLSAECEQRLRELLARRADGEPVAYLTGIREFWSMELNVTRDVLIPRPETELLVERALAHIPDDAGWTIADLGTGSGAVALAIAKERPGCQVIATDASAAAISVARGNAQRLGIANVEFRHGDWFTPLADSKLEIIVSNPPYVREGDPHLTQGDVRFEPRAALTAGKDGLDAMRTIAANARAHLKPNGWLLLEHGYDQAQAIRVILVESGFRDVFTYPDLAGQDRITEGII